jgi:hypothetical protein
MIKRMKLVRRFSAEPRFEISHVPAIKSATEASWPNIKTIHLAHVSSKRLARLWAHSTEVNPSGVNPPVETILHLGGMSVPA